MFTSLGIDTHGLDPPRQDEADNGEGLTRFMNHYPGIVVGRFRDADNFAEGLVADTAEVSVHFQQLNNLSARITKLRCQLSPSTWRLSTSASERKRWQPAE